MKNTYKQDPLDYSCCFMKTPYHWTVRSSRGQIVVIVCVKENFCFFFVAIMYSAYSMTIFVEITFKIFARSSRNWCKDNKKKKRPKTPTSAEKIDRSFCVKNVFLLFRLSWWHNRRSRFPSSFSSNPWRGTRAFVKNVHRYVGHLMASNWITGGKKFVYCAFKFIGEYDLFSVLCVLRSTVVRGC